MATTFNTGLVPNPDLAAQAAATAIPGEDAAEGGAPLTGATQVVGEGNPSSPLNNLGQQQSMPSDLGNQSLGSSWSNVGQQPQQSQTQTTEQQLLSAPVQTQQLQMMQQQQQTSTEAAAARTATLSDFSLRSMGGQR